MCGLIALVRSDGKRAKKGIARQYNKQKSRGSDGFGYIALSKNKLIGIKRDTTEKGILAQLRHETADAILFHHRYPTSTPNLLEATHPITVVTPAMIFHVIHNGIIWNSAKLKTKHEALGYRYTTEILKKYITVSAKYTERMHNDSEALAIEFALYQTGVIDKFGIEGSAAFIALETDIEGNAKRLHYGRGSQPLGIAVTPQYISLASESGTTIAAHTLYTRDMASGATSEKPLIIGESEKPVNYSYGFDYRPATTAKLPVTVPASSYDWGAELASDGDYLDCLSRIKRLERNYTDAIASKNTKKISQLDYELEEAMTEKEEMETIAKQRGARQASWLYG